MEDNNGWISTLGNEPEQYSAIQVMDKKGKVFEGGYYQENGKVCINLPNDDVRCYDLEENFRYFKHLPPPPAKPISHANR